MRQYSLKTLVNQRDRRRADITFRPIAASPAYRMQLSAGMKRVRDIWVDARGRLIDVVAASGITTDDVTDDVIELIDLISAAAVVVVAQVTSELPVSVRRAERRHSDKWVRAVSAQTGVDVSGLLVQIWDDPFVKAQAAEAARLITNVSNDTRERITAAVLRGISDRTPTARIGQEISEALGITRRRANLIAQDQANKLNAVFDRIRQTDAGLTQYRWRHSGKVNARENHLNREGKIFDWDKPPADGHPRTQPYCGCVAQAYLPLLEEI